MRRLIDNGDVPAKKKPPIALRADQPEQTQVRTKRHDIDR